MVIQPALLLPDQLQPAAAVMETMFVVEDEGRVVFVGLIVYTQGTPL